MAKDILQFKDDDGVASHSIEFEYHVKEEESRPSKVFFKVTDHQMSDQKYQGHIRWDGCMSVDMGTLHICYPLQMQRTSLIIQSLWPAFRPFFNGEEDALYG